jgi:hypothetical protein
MGGKVSLYFDLKKIKILIIPVPGKKRFAKILIIRKNGVIQ